MKETARPRGGFVWLGWSSLFFALLQSVCTAFTVMSGLRLLLGAAALASAIGAMNSYDHLLHIDTIRAPMMAVALVGSLFNLAALWRVRRLRCRPASAWRQKTLTSEKRDSEYLQLALSLVTLILLAVEFVDHIKTTGHI